MSQSEDSSRVQQGPKYHGLFNQGATCYLNSVLQVLFMTKDFRKAVESSTDEKPDTMDHHLNTLFSDLQKYSANTFNITKALDINTVYKQRDAAEYIEKILRLTSDGASKIFRGLLSRRTKCCKCKTETDRDEAFWHLPLALVDSCSDGYSVVDGIKDFFKVSVFSGDQMYCNTCDDKVDATAQYVMKHHPDVLILLLKRFEFDYHHMSYVKISRAVDVPSTIDIPEIQTYKLYAVVDHFGELRWGHYTATIKDEDEDRWYNFNDRRVSPCDDQPFHMDNMMRSQTAQLLFYRKMKEAVIQDKMFTNHDQCEDAEMTGQRDDGENDVEPGDDPAVTVSVGEKEVTGNEGEVRDGHEGNIRETGTHRNQEDSSVNMQEIKEGTQRQDDAEDIRGKAEADQPQICDLPNQKDETNDTQSTVMDAKTEKDEIIEDKDSEQPQMDYLNRDTEHLSESELDKQDRSESQNSSLKSRQQFDLDNERHSEARPIISKNRFVENLGVEEKDNVKNENKGFGQKNAMKQAEEKEEKGDPEQFLNDIGPAKTNKRKRGIAKFLTRGKKRAGPAKETLNSSHHNQNPESLTESESGNSSVTTALPVPESNKQRIKKQHRKEKEKKAKTTRCLFQCFTSYESGEED